MGLIQNKVTVSQPNSHVVVKNAGGLRGLTGETGPQGPQGVPGEAATVTAGTTTTLPAGSDATVQNVGSTSAAIFNFGIPKGDKGDTGETGAAATISVGTTTTLEPGEDATVTNSGTSSAAVFDFGIPKGAKGDTGSQGPAGQDGADGFSPTATVTKTGDTATITITDKNGTTTAQISDGVTPTIDPALSPTSENPVQNKVVTNALAGKADKPIIVSSLPATGTAGQEYFVDDRYNTVTELKGDTTQTTYSGKNLYEGSPSFNAFVNISGWEDGGTYNGMPVVKRAGSWGGAYKLLNVEAGNTYTFSLWVKADEAKQGAIYSSGSSTGATATISPNSGVLNISTNWERVSLTFECSVSGTVALRVENWTSSTTNYTYIAGYQLEKNSSATSFEPYVGGTASPNPGYPQEVQTVTGEQTVTVVGKNLLNESTMEQGTFNYLNNQDSAHTGIIRMPSFISCQPNTTYTVSSNTILGEFAVVYKDINGNIVEGQGFSVETQTYTTFTTKSNATEMRIRIGKGAYPHTAGVDYKLQLELGNRPTSYQPYQGGSYPVNLGKNLLPFTNQNFTLKGVTFTVTNGTLYLDGTSEGETYADNPTFKDNFSFTLQPGTYILSRNTSHLVTAQIKKFSDGTNIASTNGTYTTAIFTLTEPTKVVFGFYMYQNVFDNVNLELMLEKGSVATTYAPHFTPIELCKIGTYQDYIYKSGDDWYIHKDINKVVFNGSEAWGVASTNPNMYYLANAVSAAVTEYPSGYSDYFTVVTRYPNQHLGELAIRGANKTDLMIRYDTMADTTALTTWLGTHNTSLYYPFATPTDTQITNATLISELDALATAKIMLDGGTATVTSQYLPAILTTAYNSNSGYIDYIYDGTNFVKVR